MPEQDRIVIASGQKDDPSSADNSLHPSPGPYRSPSRTSSNQHSVMFADTEGNEDRGTADLEMRSTVGHTVYLIYIPLSIYTITAKMATIARQSYCY